MDFEKIKSEINKYSKGVHLLKGGISTSEIRVFEEKTGCILPRSYEQWLRIYNGGELFALPVGTSFSGILGERAREKGLFYLEDNLNQNKKVGIPDNLFVIGLLCDGEIIAFDLERTDGEDGYVVQFDPESFQIIDEWNGFEKWIKSVLDEGKELYDYEGNELE